MKIHVELKRVTAHYMNHYRYEHTLPGIYIQHYLIMTTFRFLNQLKNSLYFSFACNAEEQ